MWTTVASLSCCGTTPCSHIVWKSSVSQVVMTGPPFLYTSAGIASGPGDLPFCIPILSAVSQDFHSHLLVVGDWLLCHLWQIHGSERCQNVSPIVLVSGPFHWRAGTPIHSRVGKCQSVGDCRGYWWKPRSVSCRGSHYSPGLHRPCCSASHPTPCEFFSGRCF